jgi:hypothetical protein
MKFHIVHDIPSGHSMVRGANGLLYTPKAIGELQLRAGRGDPEARAQLAEIELPRDVDPRVELMQMLRDCPDCRAALERGEQPIIATPADLAPVRRRRTKSRWRTRRQLRR